MTPGVEPYFESELAFLADFRDAFQRRYPAEAGRLVPDKNRVPDPHLERFVEGFAALAARIHHKLDSDLPELTEAILQVTAPHLLRPIPSLSIAQFELDAAEPPGPQGRTFPRHTALRSVAVGNPSLACRWRTGYPVTLWPIEVQDAQMLRGPFSGAPPRTIAALRLLLGTRGGLRFADLELDRLRFFLSAEKQVLAALYEILFLGCSRVVFRSPDGKKPPLALTPAECLHQVGFDLADQVLPLPRESFAGTGLLLEFLSFPAKFHFIDLGGWQAVRQAGFGNQVEVLFYLNRTQESLEQAVQPGTF